MRRAPRAPRGAVLMLIALLLVAVNLRLAITSASALLTALTDAGALTPATVVLIPAIPTAVFAVAGLGTARLAARFGVERIVLVGLIGLTAGLLLRGIPSPWIVVAGTVVGTGGLAMVNILLPAVVRGHFAGRIGPVTTAYTTLMSLGAALAAALAVPIAGWLGDPALGLAAWAVPALLALVVWLLAIRGIPSAAAPASAAPVPAAPVDPAASAAPAPAASAASAASAAPAAAPARSRLPHGTWFLAGYFALQALLSYVVMGWLPSIAQDAGLPASRAGMLLGISMAVGVVGTVLVMALGRTPAGMRIGFGVVALANLVALAGLLVAPAALPEVWAALFGLGMCAFPLVLALIAGFGRDAQESARVSGIVQSVGYSVATLGPLGAGAARQLLGDWNAVIIALAVCTVAQFAIGVLVTRVVERRRAAER
ncbi:MFS transporter [Leucobacter sp. PH1c]|uniref:MFS transporter n=1 Tax=Leucobacter sp. PH1c TaxID=1397278 RepID=UPI00046974FA|nr:MFS transporter [Leucobacter sp. PH1c]